MNSAAGINSAACAPLAAFFRQRFAQVTNPPIDPYRETLVMSLQNYVGRQWNLLEEGPEHCRQLKLENPLLTNADMARLRGSALQGFSVGTVSMCFPIRGTAQGFVARAIESMKAEAERLIDQGVSLVILSDRDLGPDRAALPSILAVSALHSHLVEAKKRHMAGLIVEAGDVKDVHEIALLLAYGASGVNPWVVFESIPSFASSAKAAENYREAVRKGILKIMSKLGISTISSYRGARMYEAEGLSPELAAAYFKGTETRFGGIGAAEVEADILRRHSLAYGSVPEKGGSDALATRKPAVQAPWPSTLASRLVTAVREGDMEAWRTYVDGMEDPSRQPFAFRDLFAFKPQEPASLKEVQSAQEIARRFSVAAMSCGAISPEAHEALAAGANSIGAWSNSGEGGEDNSRGAFKAQGLDSSSASRQVASARFGVTDEYLASALEIQIKIAQGAKPGEGGQLPGPKVDAYIASLRHSSPGKTLISPPPHHDIYSIEDLSQIIHDLRCVNPRARISVKLAAQAGIGAVAAGVAKAGADCIVVSSGDGGTGAAPLSSLDFAGSSWEAALPEIRQVLAMNGLDAKVVLQVDGRLRTARDVAIAAILGAREFSFGTAALISMGCIACGKCNLDRCPVGIATQEPSLRAKFKGRPEHLASFFLALAHDLRVLLSSLGVKSIDELAGRWDLLDFKNRGRNGNARGLVFDSIVSALEIAKRYPMDEEGNTDGAALPVLPLPAAGLRAFGLDAQGPAKIPDIDAVIIAALEGTKPLEISIKNSDRSIGAAASGHLARRRSDGKLGGEARLVVRFRGSAGQSFGAFLAKELRFELEGEANDYLGKGLSGGSITLRPSREADFSAEDNAIAGNVCFFGATSGEAYLNGQAGERFCVRNSGAVVVVEGVGNHACEYMTGGTVVVLGPTGVNFGAGMSDGRAYVLDEDGLFDTRCNSADLDLLPCVDTGDVAELRRLVENHAAQTGSPKATRILAAWEEYLPRFVLARPRA
jgi:glutamate synthase domain-containing protein 2/glutamate synthase domain-containing protein 3